MLDGVVPALIGGFPSRRAPRVVVREKRFSFGEVVIFLGYDLPRFAEYETRVIVVRCNHLERL
jgi:hypothetical protein